MAYMNVFSMIRGLPWGTSTGLANVLTLARSMSIIRAFVWLPSTGISLVPVALSVALRYSRIPAVPFQSMVPFSVYFPGTIRQANGLENVSLPQEAFTYPELTRTSAPSSL